MKRFKEFIKEKIKPIVITAVPVHGRHAVKKHSEVECAEDLKEEKQKSWIQTNDNAHIGKLHQVHKYLHNLHSDLDKHKHFDYIRHYSDDSQIINSTLIGRHLRGDSKPIPDSAKTLDKVIKSQKPLEKELHVYHGTNTWNPGEEASKHPERLVHMPAFTSTTISKRRVKHYTSEEHNPVGEAGSHVLHIRLKPGQHGAYIGDHGSWENEHEFLLPHSQTLRVHSEPIESAGMHIWRAEIVHDH